MPSLQQWHLVGRPAVDRLAVTIENVPRAMDRTSRFAVLICQRRQGTVPPLLDSLWRLHMSSGKPDKPDDHGGGPSTVTVDVATPSNESRPFTVNAHERVDKLARDAVKEFVAAGLMADLDCGLALVVAGVATPLDDTARLDELNIHTGARLVLVVKKPKTDG